MIERDGKFELVSASDMQADQPIPTPLEDTGDRKVSQASSQRRSSGASTHNADPVEPEEPRVSPSKEDVSRSSASSSKVSFMSDSSSIKKKDSPVDSKNSSKSSSTVSFTDSSKSFGKSFGKNKADSSKKGSVRRDSTDSSSKKSSLKSKDSTDSIEKGSVKRKDSTDQGSEASIESSKKGSVKSKDSADSRKRSSSKIEDRVADSSDKIADSTKQESVKIDSVADITKKGSVKIDCIADSAKKESVQTDSLVNNAKEMVKEVEDGPKDSIEVKNGSSSNKGSIVEKESVDIEKGSTGEEGVKNKGKEGSTKDVEPGNFSDSWCSSSSSIAAKSTSVAAPQSIVATSSTGGKNLSAMPSKVTNTSMENHPSSMGPKAVSDSYTSENTGSWKSKERTESAHEYTEYESGRQVWEDTEAYDKRVRNEYAYKAWLVRKDAQMAEERKLVRLNTRIPTREERLEKIEHCKQAYRAWLENKTREIRQRRLEERLTKSATQFDSERIKTQSTLSFEVWLEQKHQQRRKEHQLAMKKAKEEDGILTKVEPSIAQLAYKRYGDLFDFCFIVYNVAYFCRWLQQKNFEARQEALRRLEMQKLYYRQGRRLKQSLRAR